MCYNRLMRYNWQQSDWPEFRYDGQAISDSLLAFIERVGRISGLLEGLSEADRSDAVINILAAEAMKTSEIEGEYLSRADVMSSIRNNLGLGDTTEPVKDRRAKGVVDLMLAVRGEYAAPLSDAMLFDWHQTLLAHDRRVMLGAWRTHAEPMQVISGPIGKETVHFEAPPSDKMGEMMMSFISWFNATGPDGKMPIQHAPIRSAIAHLYFETIHPFEDGNGRIGRAISEKALSQGLGRPVVLSLSRAIEGNKKAYYEALKTAQRTNEITPWLIYFLDICLEAQSQAETQIRFTLEKARYFDRFKDNFNERQMRVLRRMMEDGPGTFKGGMSAKKYVAITKTSKATATRDLSDLVEMQALISSGGGRSVRYWLPFDQED